MRFMGDFLKNINWKHVLIMCIGNVFAGMGIGIFKLAGLGTDPFSGMNMAVADMIGMAYGNFQLIVNIVLLIIEIAFGRRFLGIGTVVNAVCLAYITTFFYNIYTGVFGLELVALPVRLVALCVGVVICCLGLSMYQMPDEGVAPYDSLSLIMTERWPKIPYFWHRMSNDVLCALLTSHTENIQPIIDDWFCMKYHCIILRKYHIRWLAIKNLSTIFNLYQRIF